MGLTSFKVLAFDVYGTLIDWETGIVSSLETLTKKVKHHLSRNDILEAHALFESSAQQQTPAKPYNEILAGVYRSLAEQWKVRVTHEECVGYGSSIANWPAFGDTVDALFYLKKYYKLVVLSNVDNWSFSTSRKKLQVAFDVIYTAEDIGSYKPDIRNFEYMIKDLNRFGFARNEILHVAESMFHDHAPANEVRLASCWIYRRHDQKGFGATMDPGVMPSYSMKFNSMAALVAAHKAEMLDEIRPIALER